MPNHWHIDMVMPHVAQKTRELWSGAFDRKPKFYGTWDHRIKSGYSEFSVPPPESVSCGSGVVCVSSILWGCPSLDLLPDELQAFNLRNKRTSLFSKAPRIVRLSVFISAFTWCAPAGSGSLLFPRVPCAYYIYCVFMWILCAPV